MRQDGIEKTSGFKRFKSRMGTIEEIETEKIIISEFNTRCRFVNENHVKKLMASMDENGFIPKCAVWLNAVTDDGTNEGKILQYRLMAGRHRHEAASRMAMEKIPSQIFYNLADEDECELDRLDNKLDDTHEPINFLAEAEYLKFLQEKKDWSVRKISRHTGIDKNDVFRRLKIANLPSAVKEILNLSPMGDRFSERHLREICRLKKDPNIIAVCAKIAERAEMAANNVKVKDRDNKLKPVQPMKQTEIEELVKKYLKIEREGKIVKVTKEPVPIQLEFPFFNDESEENSDRQQKKEESYCYRTLVEEDSAQAVESPQAPSPAEPIPEIPGEMISENNEKVLKGLKADMFPKWVRSTGIVRELGASTFMVMEMIGEYALWFTNKKDARFFLSKEFYEDPLAHLAEGAGLTRDHLQKKILPDLKKLGFIDYEIQKGEYQFRFIWDRLLEIYIKKAYKIPFIEGGLKNMSSEHTGIIRITPYHYIGVSKGKMIQVKNGAPPPVEKEQEPASLGSQAKVTTMVVTPQTTEQEAPSSGNGSLLKALIEELGLARNEADRIIGKYPQDKIEKALKLSKEKESPSGWFLKALEDNYNLRDTKDKDLYARFRKEADNCYRNCSGNCAGDFRRYDKEKDSCFWCAKFDSIRDKSFALKN